MLGKLSFAGLLCLLFVGQSTVANDIDFKIQDYIPEKFVDLEWRLDGSLNASGGDVSGTEMRVNGVPIKYDDIQSGYYNRSNQGLRLASQVVYVHETIPRYLMLSGRISGNIDNRDNDSQQSQFSLNGRSRHFSRIEKSQSRSISFDWSGEAGYYFGDDWLLRISAAHSSRYNSRPDHTSEEDIVDIYPESDGYVTRINTQASARYDREDKRHRVRLELTPGWGRFYEGKFASLALYMIEELENHGALERTPTKEEMTHLSDIIYQWKMRHAVDYRLHRMEALKEILTYLEVKGIVDNLGPYGSMLIVDVWDYFGRYSRQFGLKATAGAGVGYQYSGRQFAYEVVTTAYSVRYHPIDPESVDTLGGGTSIQYSYDRDRIDEGELYLVGRLMYSHPITRKWQIDGLAEGLYWLDGSGDGGHLGYGQNRGYMFNDYSYYRLYGPYRESEHYRKLALTASATYYHDSRTTAGLAATYQKAKREGVGDEDRWFESDLLNFRGRATYRISMPTTLLVTVSYTANDDDRFDEGSEWNDQESYTLQLSLLHYLR